MIDILLRFYGEPALLRQTVRSVLAQTSTDFRLVVVDDGYPDESIAPWFEDLADPRVEYHRNARNLGANLNYMHALSLAGAEHVVVMGADDRMLPRYLQTDHRRRARGVPGRRGGRVWGRGHRWARRHRAAPCRRTKASPHSEVLGADAAEWGTSHGLAAARQLDLLPKPVLAHRRDQEHRLSP